MTSEQLTESQAPPFFSIVIPSYNNAGYLRKCILSLQKQKLFGMGSGHCYRR